MTGPPTVLSLSSMPFTVTLTLRPLRAIDRKYADAVLGRVVGIDGARAGREIGQVDEVASVQRQILDLLGVIGRLTSLFRVHQRSAGRFYGHHFSLRAR